MKTNLTLLRGALGALLVGSAISANALVLNLTGLAPGLSQSVTVAGPVASSNVGAGAFVGSLSGAPGFADANPFYTYCVELTQSFVAGTPLLGYTIVGGMSYAGFGANAAMIVGRLGRLFTHLGGVSLPTNAQTSAAIQLAVWESIYETGGAFSVGSMGGNIFQVTSPSSAATVLEATTLLAAAAAVTTNLYSISVLTHITQQDFLLIRRLPLPGTLALSAFGLVALTLARRRRA